MKYQLPIMSLYKIYATKARLIIALICLLSAPIALAQPIAIDSATQSSTVLGAGPERAIDGNTAGKWVDASVTHTSRQNQPSWTADIGATAQIDQITVYNRTDKWQERLSNFYVLISENPFGNFSLSDSLANPATTAIYVAALSSDSISLPINTSGRFVRIQLQGTDYLSLVEVELEGTITSTPAEPGDQIDIASASQSSTVLGANAARAIDSNTDGKWANDSVTHTANQNQAWWEADIGQSADVTQVILYNRTDKWQERLSNFYVITSDQPFGSDNLSDLLNDASVNTQFISSLATDSHVIYIDDQIRYVRVQLQQKNYLSLAEVSIYGELVGNPPTPPTQAPDEDPLSIIATEQSSTVLAGIANRANDGNTDGKWANGSVTHTRRQLQPWWTADIGHQASLSHITLHNRTDKWQERLNDFYVLVSSTPFSSDSLTTNLNDPNVDNYYIAQLSQSSTTLPISSTGRYVRVQLSNTDYLSLAEVELYGDLIAVPPTPTMPDLNEYEMIFSDEFSGSSLDPLKWNTALLWGPYLTINAEEQLYVDTLGLNQGANYDPFTLTGDSLLITVQPTTASEQPPPRPAENEAIWNDYPEYRFNSEYDANDVNYLSGIITSYDELKMTHGYVETRMKLPEGRGLWPAFWMLPTHYVKDVPEIDVMEYLGHDTNTLYHTYHYFDIPAGWQKVSTPSYPVTNNDWTADFHTFGMAWTPSEIIWYVDGVETKRITDANYTIANQAMYLIANMAVGGWWPGAPDSTTPFPAVLEIDYIRAYKRKLDVPINLSTDYQLVFSDEFNGSGLDASKWSTHRVFGPYWQLNNEQHYHIDALSSDSSIGYSPFDTNNGSLSITSRLATDPLGIAPPSAKPPPNDPIWSANPSYSQNGPYLNPGYTSGIVSSQESFNFANGYVEMRAQVPQGTGLWSLFQLKHAFYVGALPEIDIAHIDASNTNNVQHKFFRKNNNGVAQTSDYTTTQGTPVSADFHTYGLQWTHDSLTWFIDGTAVKTHTDSTVPYQIMYLTMELGIGGDIYSSGNIDDSAFPAELNIDWVRVYQATGP